MERKAKFTANGILKLDRLLRAILWCTHCLFLIFRFSFSFLCCFLLFLYFLFLFFGFSFHSFGLCFGSLCLELRIIQGLLQLIYFLLRFRLFWRSGWRSRSCWGCRGCRRGL